jgi:hypothetical protein
MIELAENIRGLNHSTEETIPGVEAVCAECGLGIDYTISRNHIGTSDLVIIPEPCSACYPSPEEQGYAIGEAVETAEHEAIKKTLETLLSLAASMSTNDWDVVPDKTQEGNLRKIVDCDSELASMLYLIDKGMTASLPGLEFSINPRGVPEGVFT